MAKIAPITEQFQHFVRDLKETFWGDLYGKTRLMWERFWEEESQRERDRYVATESYERAGEKRRSSRHGFYVRDFVTRPGQAFRVFRAHWREVFAGMVKRLERDLPELLSFFGFSPTAVEKTLHHQRHRALLRRGPPAHPAHGLLPQRRQRRPDHLCHLQRNEREVPTEKSHPPAFYTSSLTSPTAILLVQIEPHLG